ncbi:MAG: cysteine desulfurase, partial [Candidatus Eremiobacteraeota bacterium]|nr:cysteine desulfurase [Candidatus Eremiobacteraeota bacterium]
RRERGRHVVGVVTEHHAVLRALDALADEGFEIELLPVDAQGRIDSDRFAAALRDDTVLAAVMYANNEIGTIAPIDELARRAHARGTLLFSDAIQAAGQLPLRVDALGVDALALSAHKFYGPKGAAALYIREGTPLEPLIHGGGQERGRRAGTEDVAGVVGLVAGLELAESERAAFAARVGALRDRLQAALERDVPALTVNGKGVARLPNNLSVSFAGLDAEPLLIRLDLEGVAAPAGSACAAGSLEPSHVIAALGLPEASRRGTVRFSLGRSTTAEEIDRVATLLPPIVAEQRRLAAVPV